MHAACRGLEIESCSQNEIKEEKRVAFETRNAVVRSIAADPLGCVSRFREERKSKGSAMLVIDSFFLLYQCRLGRCPRQAINPVCVPWVMLGPKRKGGRLFRLVRIQKLLIILGFINYPLDSDRSFESRSLPTKSSRPEGRRLVHTTRNIKSMETRRHHVPCQSTCDESESPAPPLSKSDAGACFLIPLPSGMGAVPNVKVTHVVVARGYSISPWDIFFWQLSS